MATINDALVVASAYETAGNGGRKLVRLSNKWLVAGEYNPIDKRIYFQVSKNAGATWQALANTRPYTTAADFSLASKGTRVFCLTVYGSTAYAYFYNFDAAGAIASPLAESVLDALSSYTAVNCSLAINETATELHAVWDFKYSTNSILRYKKGTINAEGTVSWGALESLNPGNLFSSPSIAVQGNLPIITCIANLSFSGTFGANGNAASINGNKAVNVFKRDNSLLHMANFNANWSVATLKIDTENVAYYYSAALMVIPPSIATKIDSTYTDGLLAVAWRYVDTSGSTYKIMIKASKDKGLNWFDFGESGDVVMASANLVYAPTLSFNSNGDIFIAFHLSTGYTRWIKRSALSDSWESPVDYTVISKNPSALLAPDLNFTAPLLIYVGTNKVGFSGAWSTVEMSALPGFLGIKTIHDKDAMLSYNIAFGDTGLMIIEKVNGVVTANRNVASGTPLAFALTQEQWDAIQYGKYADNTGNKNTLTVEISDEVFSYPFEKRLANDEKIDDALEALVDSKEVFLPAAKYGISQKINSKGGSASVNDSFEALAQAIKNLGEDGWVSYRKSGLDENNVYTIVTFYRSDNTRFMDSILSGGTSPLYTTRTETLFSKDGTTELESFFYTISYDADGNILSGTTT